MNPHQLIAYTHPCFLAEETARPRFGHRMRYGSLVLSINSGYE